MKKTVIIIALFCLCILANAQSKIVQDFTPVCDSLAQLIQERTGVEGPLKVKSIMKRGASLDFYFTESLGDFPWRKGDIKWLKNTLKGLFPEEYTRYRLGEIYSRKVSIEKLTTPHLTNDGKPNENRHKVRYPSTKNTIVTQISGLTFPKGLSGRHIALWQSHGKYFNQSEERWTWQRPCLFQTCEDMFTQGFVLPYLVPMLENAGAYMMLPRERDIQTNEIIADNDSTSSARGMATYEEKGRWEDAGTGFADPKDIYSGLDNPFAMGTARQARCVGSSSKANASVIWTPDIPERGEYAVYISYRTLPSSTTAAHYTVHHLGGVSEFAVNQRIGGGTWIYLGTFEFDKGKQGFVTLDNGTPEGHRLEVGAVVSADAVRFGGGMGNIARNRWVNPEDSSAVKSEPVTSGMARSAEAARYWLQWAGADTTVYHQNEGKDDYRDDFMSRGDWVEWISRGSRVNPDAKGGLGIPVDLSFGFHTDAGVTPGDSLIGTLAIYTYKSENKTKLPAGEDRLTSRMYADIVQSQLVNDLRILHDSLWTRRSTWDRGYRESRTPSCPAILLELLSHQNFSDMKYGLDPTFRFDVCRAVYKGMLKYLSNRYGIEYVVQPLPVTNIGVEFGNQGKGLISWSPATDPLEPTAVPTGYILYSRIADGAFDGGTVIKDIKSDGNVCSYEIDIMPGKVMSFRIVAYNDGGKSFPSETVSIGIPAAAKSDEKRVLVVNNFDRISGPAWFDSGTRAGFDNRTDSGVPYIRDITYVGEMYNYRRDEEWISNDRPGFGASYSDMAGNIIAGNTFDYPSVHGKAILDAGYPFYSCSNERFCSDSLFSSKAWSLDLICGKQVTTAMRMKQDYTVFPYQMQSAIKDFTSNGGNILVSGAYIGTDIWDNVYPVKSDSTFRAEAASFASSVLGYRFVTNQASRKCSVTPTSATMIKGLPAAGIVNQMNPKIYCVKSPDGIAPSDKKGQTIYRYTDSGISAGVAYQGDGYRSVSLGFPIETVENPETIGNLIQVILQYFTESETK